MVHTIVVEICNKDKHNAYKKSDDCIDYHIVESMQNDVPFLSLRNDSIFFYSYLIS